MPSHPLLQWQPKEDSDFRLLGSFYRRDSDIIETFVNGSFIKGTSCTPRSMHHSALPVKIPSACMITTLNAVFLTGVT